MAGISNVKTLMWKTQGFSEVLGNIVYKVQVQVSCLLTSNVVCCFGEKNWGIRENETPFGKKRVSVDLYKAFD